MAPAYGPPRPSVGALALTLASCLACIYVGGRLWFTTRELQYVREELSRHGGRRELGDFAFPTITTPSAQKQKDVLFYSVRPQTGPAPPLRGSSLAAGLPSQPADDDLLGQVDGVEAGLVTGWACFRGKEPKPLQVHVYVDGTKVGEATAEAQTPHHVVHRLCQLDTRFDAAGKEQAAGVGFQLRLPPLPEGPHELRAFVVNVGGTARQELNQSPLPFVEQRAEPGAEEALRRKDAIIRVRNAQVAALWEELHTRQPWRNALDSPSFLNTPGDGSANASSRALVVFGINTGIGARERRDTLRRSWVPTGERMKALEARGIYIRFVIGYSEQRDDPDEVRLREEMREFGDVLRIDITDSYADLTGKTLKMFAVLPQKIAADFYFKVDDDVAVNVDAMEYYLTRQRTQGNLYMGCMKSGQVLTDRRYKWFEPEFWRFGDPASDDGQINYMRHASGQIYGLSGHVARYISANHPILHKYANEDISVGAWLLGLDVTHVDERRLCCDSEERCKAQTSNENVCLSYYEHQCAGICSSEQRLEPIWRGCLDRPLEKGAVSIPHIPEGQTKNPFRELPEDEEEQRRRR